jgi:hypothetical protein
MIINVFAVIGGLAAAYLIFISLKVILDEYVESIVEIKLNNRIYELRQFIKEAKKK